MAVDRPSSSSFSSDDVVIKSPNDRRLYRVIHLKNGLSAVLVHDPEIFAEEGSQSSKTLQNDQTQEDEDSEDLDEEDDEESSGDEDEEEDSGEEEEEEDELNEKKSCGGAPPTKKAAAALCVGMGSFSDPLEAPGLAHFLEHMLFMGSTEFPDEKEYDSYLSKHGGSSNAYTETEYTCYYFEVNSEFLKGALERFSQFFISPLVKAEAMEREVLAVDSGCYQIQPNLVALIFSYPVFYFLFAILLFYYLSDNAFVLTLFSILGEPKSNLEFNQVLQSDSCRLQQLQCHTASPGHSFNKFFWGNKKSLVDAMDKGINLREQVLQLFKENYHGGLKKLVVIGGESLDILEDWVLELFSNVKEGQQLKPEEQLNIPIWKAGKLYRLEAVKEVHSLDLAWTLPCLKNEYLKKPEDYLAHLLGHECKFANHQIFPLQHYIDPDLFMMS